MNSIVFIAAGGIEWGSSRMRAWWPARFIPDAQVVTWEESAGGQRLPPAPVYVFQKYADPATVMCLRAGGARVFWDVCDPAWWFDPAGARELAAAVDGVVASNKALAADFTEWSGRPCAVIPDRLLLEHYNHRAEHGGGSPVRLIWYGMAQNRMALYAAAANLLRLAADGYRIALTICDNAPEQHMVDIEGAFPIFYTRWSLQREAETLAAHDVALLPPYPGPWGQVKSDNRKASAWATGLPTVNGVDYELLTEFVTDVELRCRLGSAGLNTARRSYDVAQSAADWQALVARYVEEAA